MVVAAMIGLSMMPNTGYRTPGPVLSLQVVVKKS